MRRILSALLLAGFLFTLPSLSASAGVEHTGSGHAVFSFPAALQTIEEEAFASTAVRTVVFQTGLLRIDDRAFEEANHLENVYVPATTTHIGKSAFPRQTGLTLHGDKDSYIQVWARVHKIRFSTDKYIPTGPNRVKTIHSLLKVRFQPHETILKKEIKIYRRQVPVFSMRPQDRPELNPIDYRFP